MNTVLFEVMAPEAVMERTKAILRSGQPDEYARVIFPTAEDMARTLTPGRWRLIAALTGAGALGVRELARRVARDVKGVHTEANALVSAGVIDRTADGKYLFPFEHVKVQFELHAVA
ncbi:MAG TPA: hypothetical protein PKZ68_08340 [Pseudomonadales bacterium]|jgi:predicted transcriptional regulator|nr:hypothetical protein [Pseudomonadales bacterium]